MCPHADGPQPGESVTAADLCHPGTVGAGSAYPLPPKPLHTIAQAANPLLKDAATQAAEGSVAARSVNRGLAQVSLQVLISGSRCRWRPSSGPSNPRAPTIARAAASAWPLPRSGIGIGELAARRRSAVRQTGLPGRRFDTFHNAPIETSAGRRRHRRGVPEAPV